MYIRESFGVDGMAITVTDILIRAVAVGLTIIAIPLGAAAGSLDVAWDAPTTNADGSPLIDLAGYRVYTGTSDPECPGPDFFALVAPAPGPGAGDTVVASLTGLTAGAAYWTRVTAVDTAGNESECSPAISGIARPDTDVTPTALDFGQVAIGTTPTLDLAIHNVGPASLSGAVTTAPPFSVVGGDIVSLAAGASQVVRVAFTPLGEQVYAGTVTLTTDTETVDRSLHGSGVVTTPAVLQFSQTAYPVTEGEVVGITVTRTGGVHGGVTVHYTTLNGTAAAGVDYEADSGMLTFGPGVTTQMFSVKISRDRAVETTETITLALSSPSGGAVLGPLQTATVIISERPRAASAQRSP